MHHTGGPGWRITMDTSGPMLIALYVRDAAGLDTAGHPALSHPPPPPPQTGRGLVPHPTPPRPSRGGARRPNLVTSRSGQ